jgi:lipopolysaccharide transport system permease protein
MARRVELPLVVSGAPGRWPGLGLAEAWAYRELLGFLVWREVKVRYAQTLLGFLWVVLQPVIMVTIFVFIFGRLMAVPSDGVPYALFSLAGLIPWLYISGVISAATESLVAERNLITKVYFPRLLVPMAPVIASMLDLAIGTCLVVVLANALGWAPAPAGFLVLPVVVCAAALSASGVGLVLATLNLQFRDVRYTVPFLLQVWMFASPVVYPASIVPEHLRPFYALNPAVAVIEGYRAALTGADGADARTISISLGVGVLLFVGGLLYFRFFERTFADRI